MLHGPWPCSQLAPTGVPGHIVHQEYQRPHTSRVIASPRSRGYYISESTYSDHTACLSDVLTHGVYHVRCAYVTHYIAVSVWRPLSLCSPALTHIVNYAVSRPCCTSFPLPCSPP